MMKYARGGGECILQFALLESRLARALKMPKAALLYWEYTVELSSHVRLGRVSDRMD